MGDGKINYVDFGGVMVPESSTRRTVVQKNNQTLYCVFLDDKGAKVTYPKQTSTKPTEKQYMKYTANYNPFTHKWVPYKDNISKAEFDKVWTESRDPNAAHTCDVTSYYKEIDGQNYRFIEQKGVDGWFYDEYPVSTQPKIEYEIDEGILFDTRKMKVSNLKDAKITGSKNEDEITLENSNNCTVDVSNANNNTFFSDKVKVINGSGNKVISGFHDRTTFETHNYTENTQKVTARHKNRSVFKQP